MMKWDKVIHRNIPYTKREANLIESDTVKFKREARIDGQKITRIRGERAHWKRVLRIHSILSLTLREIKKVRFSSNRDSWRLFKKKKEHGENPVPTSVL